METEHTVRQNDGKSDDSHRPENVLWDRFKLSVLPIVYGKDDLSMVVRGTGTLVRIADMRFLVTAGHVLDSSDGGYFYVADRKKRANLIPLHGKAWFFQDRVFDVGIWELPELVHSQLENRVFLTLASFDLSGQLNDGGSYAIFGYPTEMCPKNDIEMKISLEFFFCPAAPFQGDTDLLSRYDPKRHVLLSAKSDDSRFVEGRSSKMPGCLGGISGSTIWQVWNAENPTPENQGIKSLGVGVQTCVYRKGEIIRGTTWRSVIAMIWNKYPELRLSMRIHRPNLDEEFRNLRFGH